MMSKFYISAKLGALLVFLCLSCQQKKQGILVDTRDQQSYNTLIFQNQTWMTENLNYQTDTCWCYLSKSENCEKYGRLYPWSQAMQACPEGWRLPTQDEWLAVSTSIFGGNWWEVDGGEHKMYHLLKTGSDSEMNLDLPGLYSPQYDAFKGLGEIGSFWTSTPFAFEAAVCAVIDKKNGEAFMINPGSKEVGHSCRCVKETIGKN